jgi:hypothetical protein
MGAGLLICRSCGSRWYSAAAEQMAVDDAACPSCGGGPLDLIDEEDGEDEGQAIGAGDGP